MKSSLKTNIAHTTKQVEGKKKIKQSNLTTDHKNYEDSMGKALLELGDDQKELDLPLVAENEVPRNEKEESLLKVINKQEIANSVTNSPLEDVSIAVEEIKEDKDFDCDNLFPSHIFPSFFGSIITDLNKTLNFPEDYTGTALLAAISTVVGTSAKIKVKSNWFEYAPLYCCLIGNAGANKTHPLNTIFSPVRNIDKINNDVFIDKYREYQEYKKLPEKIKLENPKIVEPQLTKSILTNFTPEALNKKLNENLRGCTIVSDEMVTFFEGMNNYSKGDQISVYLSFWNNQPVTIDRIGYPIPLFIQTPFLSIIGGLQPRMIATAFPIKKLNNGFFQRFLFAFPTSTTKQCINDNECDKGLLEEYGKFIEQYFSNTKSEIIAGEINSKILEWSPKAKDFFYQWQKENCAFVNENSTSIKGEIISKYDNHFIRLSLLLQLMEDPNSDKIQIKAVKGAKELCIYFMNCAFKVLEIIQNPKEYINTLPENKKNLYNSLSKEFKTIEAVNAGKKFGIQERSVKSFLLDKILFKRISQGLYQKK